MDHHSRYFYCSWAALLLTATAACSSAVFGQHNHGPSDYGTAPTFTNLPAPPLMKGIGTASIKITTKSPAAQKYFDQGLNLLHAFWDMESYRAFREAARVDPDCAMVWWGVYNALGQNSQEMSEERAAALKKTVELAPKASDREQYYLRAISLLAEQGKGRSAWVGEMEALISKYPEDVEAQLLLANSLSSPASSYRPNGRPREGKMYGRSILQNLLRTHPEHAAVHHYWIHAAENGPRPEEALDSAEKLVKLAPNSGHMLHMPGHIYYRLGMYEKAREALLASLDFDLKYMRENKVHPINNWNYTHNLDYLVANCAEEGRYKEAAKYARMLVDIPSDNTRLRSTGLGYMLYGGNTAIVRLQMRFGLWDAAIAELEQITIADRSSLSVKYQTGILSYIRGMRAIEIGSLAEADLQLKALQQTSTQMSALKSKDASDWYFGHATRVIGVHLLDLSGSVASLRGDHIEAVKLLSDAVESEKDLGYWEPPHYTRPVLESLARAYIRAGRSADALTSYEKLLITRPNSGFALYGKAETYSKFGDLKNAAIARKQLSAVWKNADQDLPQLKTSR
ncbi:MAG: tetratricopeptide repeat protein [Acidobacteria bacterium]|nr:tetratricopeptide repeat protein [Acidobacteriota bacterium]